MSPRFSSTFYQGAHVVTIINPETDLKKAYRIHGHQTMERMFRHYTVNFCEYWPEAFFQESVYDDGNLVVTSQINPTPPSAWYFNKQVDPANLTVTVLYVYFKYSSKYCSRKTFF